MMSLMADLEALDRLRSRLDDELHDDAHTNFLQNKNYEGYILEVTSSRASKWTALAALAADMGIDAADVMAIGDDLNDASMVAGAGVGVAMGNAVDAVKAVADEITEGNDADGVACAIERLVL
jgi:hydroxymethylpyrimidine pyrophosphatase-like HAD family hydrolase